jgi:hypothetical protein
MLVAVTSAIVVAAADVMFNVMSASAAALAVRVAKFVAPVAPLAKFVICAAFTLDTALVTASDITPVVMLSAATSKVFTVLDVVDAFRLKFTFSIPATVGVAVISSVAVIVKVSESVVVESIMTSPAVKVVDVAEIVSFETVPITEFTAVVRVAFTAAVAAIAEL